MGIINEQEFKKAFNRLEAALKGLGPFEKEVLLVAYIESMKANARKKQLGSLFQGQVGVAQDLLKKFGL